MNEDIYTPIMMESAKIDSWIISQGEVVEEVPDGFEGVLVRAFEEKLREIL